MMMVAVVVVVVVVVTVLVRMMLILMDGDNYARSLCCERYVYVMYVREGPGYLRV